MAGIHNNLLGPAMPLRSLQRSPSRRNSFKASGKWHEPVPDSYLDDDWFQPEIELFDAATASAPPQFRVDTGRPQQLTWPTNVARPTSTPSNPMEQFQHYRQMVTWGTVPVHDTYLDDNWFQPENDFFDAATASAPPHSTWPSDVAPPTSTQYNPIDQTQNPGPTPVWSVNSAPVAPDMVNTPLPRLQPSGSHMNPQEVIPPEPTCSTASAPPQSSVNAAYLQPSSSSSHVAPSASTQYNPMKQPQGQQMAAQRSASAIKVPFMVAGPSRGMQPSSSYVNPQEVVPSETSHVAKKRSRGSSKVNRNVQNSSDERVMSILSKYAEKTSTTGTLDETTRSILWKHFYQKPYPSTAEKNDLAKQLRLKPTQVTNRFNHRRTTKSKKGQQIDNDPDAVDHHDTESTSTEDSENIDPDWEPM